MSKETTMTRIYADDRKALQRLQLDEDVKYREEMLAKIIKFYLESKGK